MATSGSGTLYPDNGTYTCPVEYTWTRDSNGLVSWKAQIFAIGGGSGQYDSSPCWTSFYIRGGNNSTGDLTGDLTEYCSSCSECAAQYQGRILWQHNDVRGGSLTGTIQMTAGGTLKLGYYGQRNGANTSEDYLTWSVDPASTPPSGFTVTLKEVYTNGAKIYVSVSSMGTPSSEPGRYVEAGILGTNDYGAPYRYLIASNTTASNIVVNNTSPGTSGFTIQPNTQYYYGAYASNTVTNAKTVTGTLVTLAEAPTVTNTGVTSHTATFSYSTTADGGKYAKNIQYSIDGGTTWVTAATVSTGSASSGTFTISGLSGSTSYTVKIRTNTTAGNTAGSDISITTPAAVNIYCSVSNTRKRVKRMYCSVNGQRKKVKKIYCSVNGTRKLCFEDNA